MAYTINLTNGAIFAEIPDGQTNETSRALVLLGKNYLGYGEFIAENFVHLLENSADVSFPGDPLTGQLWFDTSEQILKVYNGTAFKDMGSITSVATQPSVAEATLGDVWFDTSADQTYIFNGSAYVLVGPIAPAAAGKTGPVSTIITDNVAADHEVVEYWVNGVLVAIMSKDSEFTPNPVIAGFTPTIIPGFQLSTTAAGGNALLTGTASNSLLLEGNQSSDFLSSTAGDTTSGTLGILNDGGLTFGTNSDGRLLVTTNDVILQNVTNDGSTIFKINRGGATTSVATIDGTTARLTILNEPLLANDVVNLDYMDTAISLAVGGAGLTASQIKTLYESNADTNEFDDAEQTKLAGIETAATTDQTDTEIKALYNDYASVTPGNVDFNGASTQYWNVVADTVCTATNLGAGKRIDVIIFASTVNRLITLDADWVSFGEVSPITVPANQELFLSLTCTGGFDTDIRVAAVLENI